MSDDSRLCDQCDHCGPLERVRCERCGGPTWTIFELQRVLGRAMAEVRPHGFTLDRCPCCRMFVFVPPDSRPMQCGCGAMYQPHPDRVST